MMNLYCQKVDVLPVIFLQVLQFLSQNCCLPLPELKNMIHYMWRRKTENDEHNTFKISMYGSRKKINQLVNRTGATILQVFFWLNMKS
ncbi:hypothetical protein HRI_005192700 [Hibiscus trionum]|uniref:Uncharacterized protein n=1 Tax=Hibiscus trionum TaxID=183268 RepID=A0A9W7MWQ2_HIBTR|nr:hypothetical protein HRI_005192700 [Hibiscus trionum]